MDGTGVCEACAKICHKNHVLKPAKGLYEKAFSTIVVKNLYCIVIFCFLLVIYFVMLTLSFSLRL